MATAPHATRLVEFYVTRNGYDPTRPLRWSDLDATPFATFGVVPLVDGRYHYNARLPQGKTGQHVVYAIWQRADSTEAFYSCSDVRFGASAPTDWKDIGSVRAQSDLPVGSKVTFRLFDAAGGNALMTSITVGIGETALTAWPYKLATAVNAASSLVRIGALQASGTIVPVKSATENTVFIPTAARYSFAVDVEKPAGGGGAQYVYPDGIGGYKAGTIVQGSDKGSYQCKPYPYSGWCNQAPPYYGPGSGIAWSDAWTRLQ
jgi:chitin-binding protein